MALNNKLNAINDADVEISLLDEIDSDIVDEYHIDLIIFKAEHNLEEIFLRTQLKIQSAKNESDITITTLQGN